MASSVEKGKSAEDLACAFLEAKGYIIFDRNYRFEKAEIDIVALFPPAEIVFIEVKSRKNITWTYPEAAVDANKIRLIAHGADSYLYEKKLTTVPVRFDVVAIHMPDNGEPVIAHFEDAFRPDLSTGF